MEEELNENELEERFYSMLHYVDDTQTNVSANHDALKIIENAPRSTLRRYWRINGEAPAAAPANTQFQKVNIPKEAPKPPLEEPKPKQEKRFPVAEALPNHLSLFNSPVPKDVKKTIEILENDDSEGLEEPKPKQEKRFPVAKALPNHLSLFNSPVPKDVKKTIEILENADSKVVELESSDEDEVIEVALPPKPTITIESSDDETVPYDTPTKTKKRQAQDKNCPNGEREVSASPVPSIVSSVSDEFIHGDCIALNISSRRPDNPSFDFSLHGADILGSTPSKKKKKKKNKESATSTPVTVESAQNNLNVKECFATPKSKAKNKKQKNKSYLVTEKSVPNADVYDSDSNQSFIEINKNQTSFIVNEKSLPNGEVFEADCQLPETPKPKGNTTNHVNIDTSDKIISLDDSLIEMPKSMKDAPQTNDITINLTDSPDEEDIQENIVIGNVTGFTESDDYSEEPITTKQDTEPKFGSTKVPAILYENLDFDNLKGKDKVCKNRRYSLTSLRAEMEKFYNESWGGEDFNHREIQKNMSRDKSLWAIDPKDRMGTYTRKKYNTVTCNYCNRAGHRDDTCRLKPPVCFMCGNAGHMEPRCPAKICVNCGSPNRMYSTMCRNCCTWGRVRCAECGQQGHPHTHCPDIWRRYHNTIDLTPYLEENRFTKKHYQLFCSGCTRRGHLVHTCRLSIPFSGLPVNSPYVNIYSPVYLPPPDSQDCTISSANTPSRAKRPSKSPIDHETHVSKKRNVSENTEKFSNEPQRKISLIKDNAEVKDSKLDETQNPESVDTAEEVPDFIPIVSNNHDKKGQVIQDNEVSDTSDVITSARIYVPVDIINKLKTDEGVKWLKETTEKLQVTIETDDKSFLSIKGKLGDQEAFQSALRDWAQERPEQNKSEKENDASAIKQPNKNNNHCSSTLNDIPKGRVEAMRFIKKALESLDKQSGDPNALFKEFKHLKWRHRGLLDHKIVSPQKLNNSWNKINTITKKLNIMLLGQAGLSGASRHVRELYNIHSRLVNLRAKTISPDLQLIIGQHYHNVFTNVPRKDYEQLLQAYNSRHYPNTMYKKQKKQLNFNSEIKKLDTIPDEHTKNNDLVKEVKAVTPKKPNKKNNKQSSRQKKAVAETTMKKLIFYLRRLTSAHPNDSVLKKTRSELMRRLHMYINSLRESTKTSSKNMKKMKKVQEQAQLFLNNV